MQFSYWRVGLALLATIAAFLLSRPVVQGLLHIIRSRLDKRVRYDRCPLRGYKFRESAHATQ